MVMRPRGQAGEKTGFSCCSLGRLRIHAFGLAIFSVFFLLRCASIQPPDGGPRDESPPALRKVHRSKGGRYLRLRWDEYLSPASQLATVGIWINPPLPFRASIRGKSIRIRIDSLLPPGSCYTVWGGPGIRDFTEGNKLPPMPLWQSCPSESLYIAIPLGQAEGQSPILGELYQGETSYRFISWEGHLRVGALPEGTYQGWAWEDKDGDGKWSLTEPLWFPYEPVGIFSSDTTTQSLTTYTRRGDSIAVLHWRKAPSPWQRWQADTMPPSAPKVQLPDSTHALLLFSEPIVPLQGEALSLTERVLYIPIGRTLVVADSAGWTDTFTLQIGSIDTQAYKVQTFWHTAANAHTPFLYLRWLDSLYAPDTFWVGKKGDSLFVADACFLPGELWLSPLPTDGEVETKLRSSQGDTLFVKLPARKYPMTLPNDSTVAQWRLYGTALYHGGSHTVGLPGDSLWVPAGRYTLVGLGEWRAFWRPVVIEGERPRLVVPPVAPPRELTVGIPTQPK